MDGQTDRLEDGQMDGLKRGSEARRTNKIRDGQSLLEENKFPQQ